MKFHEGQEVKYNGATTCIDIIYDDGTCRIQNPDWDWDTEAECVANDIDYNVPFWITVKIEDLK
jgi:hypothetical protein